MTDWTGLRRVASGLLILGFAAFAASAPVAATDETSTKWFRYDSSIKGAWEISVDPAEPMRVSLRRANALREAAIAKAASDQDRVIAETASLGKQAEAQRDLSIQKAQYLEQSRRQARIRHAVRRDGGNDLSGVQSIHYLLG